MPWPENLIKKIAINKETIEKIFEKKKDEKESNKITNKANFEIFISSIFFPTQIKIKLLANVAVAYIVPNCPWAVSYTHLTLPTIYSV